MKSIRGITLISLVITIILVLILASVGTYSAINVINSSELTKFTAELKMIQTKVNEIYQKYRDNDIIEMEGTLYYGENMPENAPENATTMLKLGEEISVVQEQADIIFTENESGIISQEGYRYWDKELIKKLGLEGINQEFFVNIKNRSIVSYKGLKYEDKMYYTLEQLPNNLYNVEYTNPNTNSENGFEFDVSKEKIGNDKWKVTISNVQYNEGYINKWKVRYALVVEENEELKWNTTENMSFIIDKQGDYKVEVFHGDIKSGEKDIAIQE